MDQEIQELYKVFKKYKLKPNFTERCSSFGARQDLAKHLQAMPLSTLELEPLATYSFKALNTMGNEGDYRYFIPRLIELMVIDDKWFGYENLFFKKLNVLGFHNWQESEKRVIQTICEKFFFLKLEAKPNGLFVILLEHYQELFGDYFYQLWLKDRSTPSILQFIFHVKQQAYLPQGFYAQFIEQIESFYLDTEDSELQKTIEDFLEQYEQYLNYYYEA